jgi:hypothetical protein
LRQDMYSGVEEDRTRVDLRVLMEL